MLTLICSLGKGAFTMLERPIGRHVTPSYLLDTNMSECRAMIMLDFDAWDFLSDHQHVTEVVTGHDTSGCHSLEIVLSRCYRISAAEIQASL